MSSSTGITWDGLCYFAYQAMVAKSFVKAFDIVGVSTYDMLPQELASRCGFMEKTVCPNPNICDTYSLPYATVYMLLARSGSSVTITFEAYVFEGSSHNDRPSTILLDNAGVRVRLYAYDPTKSNPWVYVAEIGTSVELSKVSGNDHASRYTGQVSATLITDPGNAKSFALSVSRVVIGGNKYRVPFPITSYGQFEQRSFDVNNYLVVWPGCRYDESCSVVSWTRVSWVQDPARFDARTQKVMLLLPTADAGLDAPVAYVAYLKGSASVGVYPRIAPLFLYSHDDKHSGNIVGDSSVIVTPSKARDMLTGASYDLLYSIENIDHDIENYTYYIGIRPHGVVGGFNTVKSFTGFVNWDTLAIAEVHGVTRYEQTVFDLPSNAKLLYGGNGPIAIVVTGSRTLSHLTISGTMFTRYVNALFFRQVYASNARLISDSVSNTYSVIVGVFPATGIPSGTGFDASLLRFESAYLPDFPVVNSNDVLTDWYVSIQSNGETYSIGPVIPLIYVEPVVVTSQYAKIRIGLNRQAMNMMDADESDVYLRVIAKYNDFPDCERSYNLRNIGDSQVRTIEFGPAACSYPAKTVQVWLTSYHRGTDIEEDNVFVAAFNDLEVKTDVTDLSVYK